jgi:hypothetical protein
VCFSLVVIKAMKFPFKPEYLTAKALLNYIVIPSLHRKRVYFSMHQRVNSLKSVAGLSWGAHPSCLILLYRGLIVSVLEYGSVCFTNMAKTHMLGLEGVQYRALRIALGLMMGSTSNNCLCVLSGMPTLAERFAYLNYRYFVAAFYRLGHRLSKRFGVLRALNMGRCIRKASDVLSLDIVPSESFTRRELSVLLETPLVDFC